MGPSRAMRAMSRPRENGDADAAIGRHASGPEVGTSRLPVGEHESGEGVARQERLRGLKNWVEGCLATTLG